MTNVRQSYIFRPEAEFKDGGTGNWYAVPPGSQISTTHNRNTSNIQGVGSKTWEAVTYGNISGTWSWDFTLDYNYLEPLTFFFEAWQNGMLLDENGTKGNIFALANDANNSVDGRFSHTFLKRNATRAPSFTLRRIQLNRVVGGEYDELTVTRGCVCNKCDFRLNSSGSSISVSMSGIYAVEDVYYVKAESTDYQPYESQNLAEFLCYLQDGESYMPTVESISVSAGCTITAVNATCGPVIQNYAEGTSTYKLSIQTYTDDYNKLKTRALFSGGAKFSGDYADIGTDADLTGRKFLLATRGLKPMEKAVVQTSTQDMVARRGDDGSGATSTATPAYDMKSTNPYALKMTFTKLVVKGATWSKGTGNKLSENADMDCNGFVLELINSNPSVWRNVIPVNALAYGQWQVGDESQSRILIPDTTYSGCINSVPEPVPYTEAVYDADNCGE